MRFNHRYTRTMVMLLTVALLFQLTGCGTLIYSERDGQPKGKIDPTVAILDGIGLLFFVIPGLVAFAIDFHTNAIYLPPGEGASNIDEGTSPEVAFRVVPLPAGELELGGLEALISKELGQSFRFGDPDLQASKFNSAKELIEQVARANADITRQRVLARAAN